MATVSDHENAPRSVLRLWHEAQVSHRGIPAPEVMLEAIHDTGSSARHALGLAIQGASEEELVDLMIDKVLTGAELHQLLLSLQGAGRIRRSDLVDWSGLFA